MSSTPQPKKVRSAYTVDPSAVNEVRSIVLNVARAHKSFPAEFVMLLEDLANRTLTNTFDARGMFDFKRLIDTYIVGQKSIAQTKKELDDYERATASLLRVLSLLRGLLRRLV